MTNFYTVIGRASDDMLQELLGQNVARLLNFIDPNLATLSNLRNILLMLKSPHELLRDNSSYSSIIDLLRIEEAEILLEEFRLDKGQNLFLTLKNNKPGKGTARETTMFQFFGIGEPNVDSVQRFEETEKVSALRANFFYQLDAISELLHLFQRGEKRAVLHMPTGSGKTRTTIQIIVRLLQQNPNKVVVWLAFSEELCEQAASEFFKAWSSQGDRDVELQRYWGDYSAVSFIREGLVVAGLGKMYALLKRDPNKVASLADVAQLIVIDEAHQAIAETYSSVLEVLAKNKDSRILGLTATPGRTWNDPLRDAELANFFHKNKVTLQMPGYISPIDYLIDQGFLAKPLFETMRVDSPKGLPASELEEINKALEIPQGVLVRLSQDEVRNLRIIAKLEELIGRHQRILFFASTVQHSDLISAILIARGINAKSVTSKTLLADRQRYLNNFISDDPNPLILCNFGVLTTGFDAPKTSCVVIARPTKSLVLYSQMVGRGTRGPKMGGTKECEVVTVVDTFLPGFGDMSEAFRNWEDVW